MMSAVPVASFARSEAKRPDFTPQMQSRRTGITVIGALKYRAWNGVVADLWEARLEAGARGEYLSPHPRLFVLLELSGGELEMRQNPASALPDRRGSAPSLSFIPAGLRLWSHFEEATCIRHLDLHFDPDTVSERLGDTFDRGRLENPQLMARDTRALTLARLIAEECASVTPHSDLYGDALTIALLIDVMRLGRKPERRRTPLAPWQLRRVTSFIEEHCNRSIRLQELAELVDLSQSYLSHAFKASTGLPPHQWQMNARIRRVQERLRIGDTPLPAIAADAGFADQAHLTRVFRRIVGETPAVWRRAHRM